MSLLIIALVFIIFYGLITLCFHVLSRDGKKSKDTYWTSEEAISYWREKFKDETTRQQQQETLLRPGSASAEPEVLLRPAQGQEEQTPAEQLVRPAGSQEQP